MVDMVIEGTVGSALATVDLLEGLAERIDTGSGWLSPVRVYGVSPADAEALKELFAEHRLKVTILPRR